MSASNPARRRTERGFTLLELMATVAIAAIVTTVAVPAVHGWLEQQRLAGVAGELSRDLRQARADALMRAEGVRFTLQQDDHGQACYLLHTGGAAECRCGAPGLAHCDGEGEVLKVVRFAAEQGLALQSSTGSILFSAEHGTATPTATLNLQDTRGHTVRHIVNLMGRVRSCSPQSAVPGYRAC